MDAYEFFRQASCYDHTYTSPHPLPPTELILGFFTQILGQREKGFWLHNIPLQILQLFFQLIAQSPNFYFPP